MNVADIRVLLCRVRLIDIPDEIAISVSILSGLEIKVSRRQMIPGTQNLVVLAQVLILVGRAGEETRPGIIGAVGKWNELVDDIRGRLIEQRGRDTSHGGNLAVG